MANINEWLEAFPREEVEQNISRLEADLQRWRNALAMHDSLTPRDTTASQNGDSPAEPIPTKPQAIGFILKDAGRPLKSGEIRAEMIKRGWLPEGPKAVKRFYSTMTRLKGEERVKHLPDGRYTLPEPKGVTITLA